MKKALELKKKYQNGREKLFGTLIKSNDGVQFNQNHTQLVDQIVKELVKEIQNQFPVSNFSLIAVGGYGRQDLSPKSDVDLLFLYQKRIAKRNSNAATTTPSKIPHKIKHGPE